MKSDKKRLIFFTRIFMAMLILVDFRFFYLQMIDYKKIDKAVVKQRVREIIQQPERGRIIDNNGNVLAMSEMAYDIAVYPNLIPPGAGQVLVAQTLSKILNLPYKNVLSIVKEKVDWASIAKGVSPSQAIQIQKAGLGAIEISQAPKRVYPNGNLAADVLGFVNQIGQPGAGLELSMNQYLAGVPGYTIAETDPLGHVIPIGLQSASLPQKGDTVQLTLNNYMQYALQNGINYYEKKEKAKAIYGIIMNPNNGAILAMAATPTFNPNNYQNYPQSTWVNTPAGQTFSYAPGSVLKPVIMTTALNDGTIKPTSTFDDTGVIYVDGVPLHDDTYGYNWGIVNLNTILTQSLNIGMSYISETMSAQQMFNGLRVAGFGQPTGVKIAGEGSGVIGNLSFYQNALNKAEVSFGQSIQVTPLQIIKADSQVINGGHNITAHIVNKVTDSYGNVVYQPKLNDKQLYNPKYANLVKSFMVNDMMVNGTVHGAMIPGYTGGGKTGTATVFKNGKMVNTTYDSSMYTFFPAKKPKYAVLIAVHEPAKALYGSQAAGPIIDMVMSQILKHEDVPMTDSSTAPPNSNITIQVPNVKNMLLNVAETTLKKKAPEVKVVVSGSGNIVSGEMYTYQNNQLVITLQTVPIQQNSEWTIPSIIGKTEAEIQQIFAKSGIKLKFMGNGTAINQSVAPGTYMTAPKVLQVWLD